MKSPGDSRRLNVTQSPADVKSAQNKHLIPEKIIVPLFSFSIIAVNGFLIVSLEFTTQTLPFILLHNSCFFKIEVFAFPTVLQIEINLKGGFCLEFVQGTPIP